MKKLLLADLTTEYFLAMLLFALLGVIISLLIHSTNRSPGSKRSPYRFTFSFLFRDNGQRLILNTLLILVTLRFSQELLGVTIKPFVALLIGVSFDKLSEFLRNTNILDKK
jgi:hypothetical protein